MTRCLAHPAILARSRQRLDRCSQPWFGLPGPGGSRGGCGWRCGRGRRLRACRCNIFLESLHPAGVVASDITPRDPSHTKRCFLSDEIVDARLARENISSFGRAEFVEHFLSLCAGSLR